LLEAVKKHASTDISAFVMLYIFEKSSTHFQAHRHSINPWLIIMSSYQVQPVLDPPQPMHTYHNGDFNIIILTLI